MGTLKASCSLYQPAKFFLSKHFIFSRSVHTKLNTENYVKIVEVAPRDGLQNEKLSLSVDQKVKFIEYLTDAGLSTVEVGSFVSPKWIPQMANSGEVFQRLKHRSDVAYPLLVPNLKGLQQALAINVKEIAVFGAVSETFSQRNINCSIAESLDKFSEVVKLAKENNIWVRGYISCIAGCPYEGKVSMKNTLYVIERLLEMNCDEISLGDTIGIGTPGQIRQILKSIKATFPLNNMAIHCHDTYGQALANIYVSLEEGIRIVDTAVGGLGGCPYAKGATGNVSTEDVVYMLHGSGFKTGVSIDKLGLASDYIHNMLHKNSVQSKVGQVRINQASTTST